MRIRLQPEAIRSLTDLLMFTLQGQERESEREREREKRVCVCVIFFNARLGTEFTLQPNGL